MEIASFFLDTYALHEIISGNPAYKRYEGVTFVTSRLNLMELYYGLLVKSGKKIAEENYDIMAKYAVEPDDDSIKEAMEFRMANRKLNLSYVDCVGYVIARRHDLLFLTGDAAFRDMKGVEYVK